MINTPEASSFAVVKKFYQDHFIKFNKNLSFSILFLLQPQTGNGLQKITPADLKASAFSLDPSQKKEGIELFTNLCMELYPLLDAPLRKRFVDMLNTLYLDRLLVKDEDAKDIKKNILASMKVQYEQSKNVQALGCLLQDFPEYRNSESNKGTKEVVDYTTKTLSETLSTLLLEQGGTATLEKTTKELISFLVIESGNREIYAFQKDFLLLEQANAPKSSLRNLALLLLTRYFYDGTAVAGQRSPTWDYLVETYNIQVDELVNIIQKKKREFYLVLDNIKRLIETYTPAQRQESKIGSERLKEKFMNSYTNGVHEICSYLKEQLPFLSQDTEIQSLLEYIRTPQLGGVNGSSNAGENEKKKKWQGRSSTMLTTAFANDKRSNNVKILKEYIQEGTPEGVRKAAGLIHSLSGDTELASSLRESFGSMILAAGRGYSLETLREAMTIIDDNRKKLSHTDINDIYTYFVKGLLIAGQSTPSLVYELRQLIESGKCSRRIGVACIDEVLLSNLETPSITDATNTEFYYYRVIFSYIASTGLLSTEELLQKLLDTVVKAYHDMFDLELYFENKQFFKRFKNLITSRSVDIGDAEKISLLQKSFGGSFEGDFMCADLFDKIFDLAQRQGYFDAYLHSLTKECDYENIVPLLKSVGKNYTYDRKTIMQNMVATLYEKGNYEGADDILENEASYIDLTDEMKEHKFRYKLQNKKLTDYIASPEVHEAFATIPSIKRHIIKEIDEIELKNSSKKKVTLTGLLKELKLIFFAEDGTIYNEDLKKLLAKRGLEGFQSRSGIYPEYLDLYEYLQLSYGDNIEQINEMNMKKYRKLRRTASEHHNHSLYEDITGFCKQVIAWLEKKKEEALEKYKKGWDQLTTERKELEEEIPLLEYNNLLQHLENSVSRANSAENNSMPKHRGYGGNKDEVVIYYDKKEIPEVCKDLIEVKLLLVPEAPQRSLKHKTLQAWFEFYEGQKDYQGLEMLERTYGYSIDRTEEQRRSLRQFLKSGDKEKIAQIAELISLFGMSNAADILYQLYPEYKGLGSDDIESILSHYLGETLLNHKGIGLYQIPERLDISGIGLLDSLFTVIERDFVRVFTEDKKANPDEANENICQKYLDDLKSRFAGVKGNHPKLSEVYNHFSSFIHKVLSVKKPQDFVDHLVEGREFPDFLQKLNAALVTDKKRFLIADGMGLGKSLSAILAKEYGGAKSCLVVVPNLVTSTRQGYLSDIDDPATKKRGYYKKGKSPSVFTITAPADIAQLKKQSYDYVIISQEKLQGDDYVDALIAQGFDFMIVDEIHKLKNISDGKRATGLLRVTEYIEQHGGSLCLLSGTPIPNKIGDIAILLKLLYPEKYADVENDALVMSIIKGGDMLNLRSLLLPMMQMKKLTDHIDMPQLTQSIKHTTLSAQEQLYYDAFVEDNTMTGAEKLMMLRKFLLNPQLVGINSITQSSKAKQIGSDANELFKTKSKVVFFVNGFIDGVLREKEGVDRTLIDQMELDPNIEVRIIDGSNTHERQKIQDEFNSSNKKIALFISGSTADVGIDLTAGEHITHINEPWTQAELDQQEARVYRYGQGKDIETMKYISQGTIEQGIHDYVVMKHNIILKLYYGLKLSELEKRVITEAETEIKKGSTAVNTTLTKFIRSAKEKLNDMFGYLREGGLEKIEALVETRGKEMADYYALLGPRSYQANVNRMHATLLHTLIKTENITNPKIVDLGSGPKMLEQHIDTALQGNVISVDINPNHFSEDDIKAGKAIVSNFGKLPFKDGEVDMICSSLSFNETAWSRSQKIYERLDVLLEMHRALKPGGIAVISTMYSLKYKYPELLKPLLEEIGFELVPEYSGRVRGGKNASFETKTLVLRKLPRRKYHSWDNDRLKSNLIKNDNIKGLDMIKDDVTLSSQEYVLEDIEFIPSDATKKISQASIKLSKSGKTIKDTEKAYKNLVAEMQQADGVKHIADISEATLLKRGFGRYMNASSCVIMIRLPNNAGLFRYSMPLKKE